MEWGKRQRFLPYWEPVDTGDKSFGRVWSEAVVAIAISSLALLLFGGILSGLPVFREYSSFLIAASFLYIPFVLSRIWKRPWDVPRGLWKLRWSAAGILCLVVVVVLPLYGVGFGAWQGWFYAGRWCVEAERLQDWPDEVKLEEPGRVPDSGVGAWVKPGGSWAVVVGTGRASGVEVEFSDRANAFPTKRRDGSEAESDSKGRNGAGVETGATGNEDEAVGDGATSGSLRRRVSPGEAVKIVHPQGPAWINLKGEGPVLVGGREEELPWGAKRSLGWLVWFLLVQVVLVAIPEEYFYRGYLQDRLQRAFGKRWVVWGGDIGPAVWVTSAAFALGHILTVTSPFRLAVFFPSLLFGWLRDKTGSLWVPVVFHVVSNLSLELLHRMTCYGG